MLIHSSFTRKSLRRADDKSFFFVLDLKQLIKRIFPRLSVAQRSTFFLRWCRRLLYAIYYHSFSTRMISKFNFNFSDIFPEIRESSQDSSLFRDFLTSKMSTKFYVIIYWMKNFELKIFESFRVDNYQVEKFSYFTKSSFN